MRGINRAMHRYARIVARHQDRVGKCGNNCMEGSDVISRCQEKKVNMDCSDRPIMGIMRGSSSPPRLCMHQSNGFCVSCTAARSRCISACTFLANLGENFYLALCCNFKLKSLFAHAIHFSFLTITLAV